MTTKEMAERLHGREIDGEVTIEDVELARRAGLVVVYGASDDLCEFRGALHGEVDCYEGARIHFNREGPVEPEDAGRAPAGTVAHFQAIWDEVPLEGPRISWIYQVTFPHETFDIREDGEIYCRGFVFDLNAVLPAGAGEKGKRQKAKGKEK